MIEGVIDLHNAWYKGLSQKKKDKLNKKDTKRMESCLGRLFRDFKINNLL